MPLNLFEKAAPPHACLLVALSTLAALAACASGPQLPAVVVPERLNPPPDEAKALAVQAKGVQVYECRARPGDTSAASATWLLKGPEATLTDAAGHVVGQHGEGPAWESTDGSRIVGSVRQKVEAPAPGAIPWLLLETTPAGPKKGAFTKFLHVQRVATSGGVAPAGGCSAATVGQVERVPYEAQYWFFEKRW
jgi:hypothetical protein